MLLPAGRQQMGKQLGTAQEAPQKGSAEPRQGIFFKHLSLAGSLLQVVVSGREAVNIPNIRQHVSNKAPGMQELLFIIGKEMPQSLVVLPLLRADGSVFGAVYLLALVSNALATLTSDAEVLLLVAAEAIARAMQPSRALFIFSSPLCLPAFQEEHPCLVDDCLCPQAGLVSVTENGMCSTCIYSVVIRTYIRYRQGKTCTTVHLP
jgi:hypothetical protein